MVKLYSLIVTSPVFRSIPKYELKLKDNSDEKLQILHLGQTWTTSGVADVKSIPTYTTTIKWRAIVKPSKEGEFTTPGYIVICDKDTLNLAQKHADYIVEP